MNQVKSALPTNARLIDATLFDESRSLRASICEACDTLTFPPQSACNQCSGTNVSPTTLKAEGQLWGFTVQRFVPKEPYLAAGHPDGAPYGVGYVALADRDDRSQVLVETRLAVADVDQLAVGLDVALAYEQLPGADDDGIWTFVFRPKTDPPGEVRADD